MIKVTLKGGAYYTFNQDMDPYKDSPNISYRCRVLDEYGYYGGWGFRLILEVNNEKNSS